MQKTTQQTLFIENMHLLRKKYFKIYFREIKEILILNVCLHPKAQRRTDIR